MASRLSFGVINRNVMRTLLARLVLAFASLPAINTDADAEVLVLDSAPSETTLDMERRLGQQLKNCVLPYVHGAMSVEGDLVVNVSIGSDGRLHVVNAHGGNPTLRNAVNLKFNGSYVGPDRA
ncbi:MAG: hypothetical protein ABI599_06635 [Flavobacteriales bacterium]